MNMQTVNLLTDAAIVCAFIATVSLLFKAESIRGAGRIIGGLAWCFVGGAVLAGVNLVNTMLHGGSLNIGGFSVTFDVPNVSHYQWCGWIFLGCGVVTVLSGLRKFARRNSAS
jgi:hypothetical protein